MVNYQLLLSISVQDLQTLVGISLNEISSKSMALITRFLTVQNAAARTYAGPLLGFLEAPQ